MKRIKNKIIFTSLLFRLNIWLYLLQTEGHLYRHGWKSPAPFNLLPPERFDPWVGLIPWRRAWQPTLVFLPGEYHGQRSLAGYSPWGHKRVEYDLNNSNGNSNKLYISFSHVTSNSLQVWFAFFAFLALSFFVYSSI